MTYARNTMRYRWTYINDGHDQPIGIAFTRANRDDKREVMFNNNQVCLDWACMTRNNFFEKYEGGK